MCGIVGLHGLAADGDDLDRLALAMNGIQRHRGPDGEGIFIDRASTFALAMKRLAIIDIPGGAQPMRSADGRFTLVFNGEIVNAPELRADLEARGVRFLSDHSDTEVLLHLLQRDGMAALPRLNGMFAFALHDARGQLLTLARDRFGIKPLYYTHSGGRFAFASEMKSLLALPFVEREVDTQSLFHYLSLMYVPGPETILKGIRRLGPGEVLTYHFPTRQSRMEQWWRLAFHPEPGAGREEWIERVRFTLAASIERWTLSDVPIACSLSGGLDSSSIVGLLAQSGRTVSTYSLGFSGTQEEQWNELPLAAEVARKWGTEHHELIMDPASLLSDLGEMVWHMDEPYGGGLPSWAVFRHMGGDVKVGLTGTGGDELFGNYGKWGPLEGSWLRRPADTAENFRRLFFDRYYYFPDSDKRSILAASAGLTDTSALLYERFRAAAGTGVRDGCAATDIGTQLTDEFLTMSDRFSMAHSLEVRPPFLDVELVDVVTRIPASVRTHRRNLKGLLREAVAPVLPHALLTAPKKGFVLPLRLWLRGDLRPLAERLLSSGRMTRQGLFDESLFSRHVAPHLEGHTDRTTRVWGLLMFQLWHLQFIENGLSDRAMTVDDFMSAA